MTTSQENLRVFDLSHSTGTKVAKTRVNFSITNTVSLTELRMSIEITLQKNGRPEIFGCFGREFQEQTGPDAMMW